MGIDAVTKVLGLKLQLFLDWLVLFLSFFKCSGFFFFFETMLWSIWMNGVCVN